MAVVGAMAGKGRASEESKKNARRDKEESKKKERFGIIVCLAVSLFSICFPCGFEIMSDFCYISAFIYQQSFFFGSK